MNASELLKKFGVDRIPEQQDGKLNLDTTNANCVKFNRWGTYVAVGATDGRVFIVDFITRGVVHDHSVHTGPVTALSWSYDGQKFVSAADYSIAVWSVLQRGRGALFPLASFKLCHRAFPMSVQFHPRDNDQMLLLLSGQPAKLFWYTTKVEKLLTSPDHQKDTVSCAVYDRRGKHVLTGTTKGRIIIYDVESQKILAVVNQPCNQQVRAIIVPRRANFILTNGRDSIIRRYDLDELLSAQRDETIKPTQKLSDIVNKVGWKSVFVSHDGEFIGGASNKAHEIYIWDRSNGTLVKILRGSRTNVEAITDSTWHPQKPVILSVACGVVHVWNTANPDSWSAFAPDFKELEDNSKYREKEGEFDDEDEDASDEENIDVGGDDEIDVVNLEADDIGCSSDEEAGMLSCLPSTDTDRTLMSIPFTPIMVYEVEEENRTPYADREFHRQRQMKFTYPGDMRRVMLEARTMTAKSAPAKAPAHTFSRRAAQ